MSKNYSIAIDARRLRETTGRYSRELLNNLEKIDDKNTYHVIIHEKDLDYWKPTVDNFILHIVPWDNYTFGEQIGFLKFLKGLDVDLVHFAMPQQPLFYRRPKVTSIHDLTLVKFKNERMLSYLVKQAIFKFLLKNVIRTSQKIFTLAEFTRAEIASYGNVSTDKIVIAHPASDAMATKQTPYKAAVGMDFILYVGNTFLYKNISRLMQSHQQLLAKHPKLHLFVVGKIDKNSELLQKEVAQNNYKQVHFTGFVSDEELAWLYQNAKAYVFPSLSEGFGMPGLEAMQFDLPVVSSDATVLPEIYGDAAHYFDPEDIDEITKSIDEVLTNKNLRKQLIANGRVQRDVYSWKEMAEIIHESYMRTLITEDNQ